MTIIELENHKGLLCVREFMVCQEGYCSDCLLSRLTPENEAYFLRDPRTRNDAMVFEYQKQLFNGLKEDKDASSLP